MQNWNIKGVIAMIIALTFGIVLVSTIIGAIVTGRGITDATANLLSMIAGALIGVLSAYVGEKVSEK